MKFKPGQEVVCVKRDPWAVIIGMDGPMDGPKFNELVTVRGCVLPDTFAFLTFEEYPENQGYNAFWFRPVMTSGQLKEALKSEVEKV